MPKLCQPLIGVSTICVYIPALGILASDFLQKLGGCLHISLVSGVSIKGINILFNLI
jgi:hypothetical protein